MQVAAADYSFVFGMIEQLLIRTVSNPRAYTTRQCCSLYRLFHNFTTQTKTTETAGMPTNVTRTRAIAVNSGMRLINAPDILVKT